MRLSTDQANELLDLVEKSRRCAEAKARGGDPQSQLEQEDDEAYRQVLRWALADHS